jgi:hypothetical protein
MRSCVLEVGATNAAAAAAVAMMLNEFVWRIIAFDARLRCKNRSVFDLCDYTIAFNAVQPTARCVREPLMLRWFLLSLTVAQPKPALRARCLAAQQIAA